MTKKNLILWRHADAENLLSEDSMDSDRALTLKGVEQSKKIASWLKQHLPKDTLILSSPAVRAEQTVVALKRDYLVIKALKPEATLDDVLAVLQESSATNILLVGHQPWIGLLASRLMCAPTKVKGAAKMANIKKSAVWWFKQATIQQSNVSHDPIYKLVAVQHPDFI
jgi:phosphohistidine phosphatase